MSDIFSPTTRTLEAAITTGEHAEGAAFIAEPAAIPRSGLMSPMGLALAVTALLLVVVSWSARAQSRCPPAQTHCTAPELEQRWPLDRSGRNTVLLRMPTAYALSNLSAAALERHVYPEGRPTADDHVNQQILLDALWPEMRPDGDAIARGMRVPGGGTLMMALLHSGAIADFDHRHYDALQVEFDIAVDWSTKHLCLAPMAQPNFNPETRVKCFPRNVPDAKKPDFGLRRYGVDFSKYPCLDRRALDLHRRRA